MRLFIATEIPDEIKEELAKYQSYLKKSSADITLVREFHLTYAFLGEIGKSEVDKLVERLSIVKVDKIETYLSSIGFFPNEKFARVVWVGLKNEELIREQQKRIASSIRYEERFKPHLTLARIKKFHPSIVEQTKKIKLSNKPFTLSGFSLIQSNLTQDGPVYKIIKSFS